MDQVELHKVLSPYTRPDNGRSLLQTSTALGIYFASVTLLIVLYHFQVPAWVILIVSLLTAPIIVQLFIIFHDCCHASYFTSHRACSMLGHFLGILTFTSYYDWQRTHSIHHLAPRIPNYRLKECFDEIPELQEIDPVPYLSGLRNISLSLWDEKSGLLLSFREALEIIAKSK